MNFIVINEGFQCGNCGAEVPPQKGSCRNHCPLCLFSRHVDAKFPGDRDSKCLGLMEPIGLKHSGKKGWILLHRCLKCGQTSKNKSAPDDDAEKLAELSAQGQP